MLSVSPPQHPMNIRITAYGQTATYEEGEAAYRLECALLVLFPKMTEPAARAVAESYVEAAKDAGEISTITDSTITLTAV